MDQVVNESQPTPSRLIKTIYVPLSLVIKILNKQNFTENRYNQQFLFMPLFSYLKGLGGKVTTLPSALKDFYTYRIESPGVNVLKNLLQSYKMLIRYHHNKRYYNENYRFFSTIKADMNDLSNLTKTGYKTQYVTLVEETMSDPQGVNKTLDVVQKTLQKGKQNGLLSIELNELAYLLEPEEVAWQGRYLAGLKG